MKRKVRQHYEPDLQESAFWKKIMAYQRKLLVRVLEISDGLRSDRSSHTRDLTVSLSLLPQNYFARNFYNMRMLALFVAFAINFILLFYKVMHTSVFSCDVDC